MVKKILITGKNSYIGTSLEKWLMKEPDKYMVDSISVRSDSWKETNFSLYDVVFHAAGIAHIKETNKNRNLYFEVNRDLAYEIAKKAKEDGAKHFLFLSTMSVYGMENGVINQDTPLKPKNAYGKSKLEAEELISRLNDDSFIVAILRPPLVYGKECIGNYQKISKIAKFSPFFPKVKNQRSMIHIDNLTELIRLVIKNQENGVFLPQNKEYVNTTRLVKEISKVVNHQVHFTKIFNTIIFKNRKKINVLNKVFGSLVYEKELSKYKEDYRINNFKHSIELTEKRSKK